MVFEFLLPFPGPCSILHDLGKSERRPERTPVPGPAGHPHQFWSGWWACDWLGGTCVGPRPQPAQLPAPQVLACMVQAGPSPHGRHTGSSQRCWPHGVCEGPVIMAMLRRDAYSWSLWQHRNRKKAQVSSHPPRWGSPILGPADRATGAHRPSSLLGSHTLVHWGPALWDPSRRQLRVTPASGSSPLGEVPPNMD